VYFAKNVAIFLLILGSFFSECVVFYGNYKQRRQHSVNVHRKYNINSETARDSMLMMQRGRRLIVLYHERLTGSLRWSGRAHVNEGSRNFTWYFFTWHVFIHQWNEPCMPLLTCNSRLSRMSTRRVHARERHDLTDCQKTRTVGAQPVLNTCTANAAVHTANSGSRTTVWS